MATEETTITELELAEEVLADMVIPVDTSTDTKSVSLKQLRAWLGSSLPTGFIIASFGKMDDERFTLLDGKTLSKQGTYGAFCAKVEEQVQAGKWFACSEEEYNADILASGQCSKFVIGVDYVRIPKLGNSLCSGVVDGKIPVVGNGITLGLTNGSSNVALVNDANEGTRVFVNTGGYGQPLRTSSYGGVTTTGVYGVTTDATKSGIEGKINSVEVFYYMVVSTEGQTAKVGVDINKVYEDINLKANTSLSNIDGNIDYVVEKGSNGDYWYRKYKSGWLEQGAIGETMEGVSANNPKSFNFLKPFKYENGYDVLITSFGVDDNTTGPNITLTVRQTTYFTVNNQGYDTNAGQRGFNWYACGQGA